MTNLSLGQGGQHQAHALAQRGQRGLGLPPVVGQPVGGAEDVGQLLGQLLERLDRKVHEALGRAEGVETARVPLPPLCIAVQVPLADVACSRS